MLKSTALPVGTCDINPEPGCLDACTEASAGIGAAFPELCKAPQVIWGDVPALTTQYGGIISRES